MLDKLLAGIKQTLNLPDFIHQRKNMECLFLLYLFCCLHWILFRLHLDRQPEVLNQIIIFPAFLILIERDNILLLHQRQMFNDRLRVQQKPVGYLCNKTWLVPQKLNNTSSVPVSQDVEKLGDMFLFKHV